MAQTTTRELSKLENSGTAMPPKFMGRDCDSDIGTIHRLHRLRRFKNLTPSLFLRHPCNLRINLFYGTSMIRSLPTKVKFGRRRPFMYFAAVCESAVMMIGSAIVASQFTYA